MKMYKLEVYVIDFEGYGLNNVIIELEDNSKFYSFNVKDANTGDIGEWTDDHVLNKRDTPIETFREYFK